MLLLAIDTATAAPSVALHDGGGVLAQWNGEPARRHAEVLTPAVREVLDRAGVRPRDLTEIIIGTGPGPFTGLRVGLVTAKVLGLTLGVPVRGACSLDALAWDARALGEPLLAVTDARRGEVYWAAYDTGARRTAGPAVDRPAAVPVDGRPAVGAGAAAHPDAFPRVLPPLHPRAGALAEARAAGALALLPAEPLYLRRPDAREPGRPKPVLPAR